MQARVKLTLALSSLLLAACSSSSNSPRAVPAPPALNDDGSPVTAVITARFDPATSVIPFPNNLLLSGTRDLTINNPVANPANFGDPAVALSSLDGFGTVSPWSFSLSAAPNPASLTAGGSIRMFEVTLSGVGGGTTGVTRELTSAEFVIAQATSDATGRTIAIVPTKALKPLTSYLVVVTDDVRDARGNDATPDQTYFLTKRTAPLCTGGVSTDPLLPTASACALEPLRQLHNSHLAIAASRGIPASEVVLTWVATTQSTSTVLQLLQSVTTAGTSTLAPTGLNTSVAGLPPVADIYIGVLGLKYYLASPTPQNPTALLTTFWRALPGNYLAPFTNFGLDPTSTNITFANPFPVPQSTQQVPVLLTVPNANSGKTKPAAGWPIVIFNHGITRNRTDALAISATMAAQGFAVIAIDQPLHGVPSSSPFYIESTPFGAISGERTFDADLVNNTTGAPGPDGVVDSSGTHFINLASLLTSRDNLRQAVADLITLAKTIPRMSYDGDTVADFDGSRIQFVGQSLGSIDGTAFLAVEPTVNVGVLSVPGGGIAQLLNGSPTFGPRIRAGLAASGVVAGTPAFDQFLNIAQIVVDSVDPVNYGFVTSTDKILAQLVVGGGTVLPDQVVPITVTGAPLSGGEAFVRSLGLTSITATTQSASGIRGVTRFLVGDHGSLLSPAASAAATAEMQGEMASMLVSTGNAVQVTNTSVIRTQ
jgi:dienelactone hydrolase